MDLAFTVSSDHFTAEQNPPITVIIIDENHSVKGQCLITSRWSWPTFEKKEPCSSIPLIGRSKVKSVSATPGPQLGSLWVH